MRPHYQCLLRISRLRVRSRPFYSTRSEYARAAAQQHSSRIYRNKNDPENREALSSRSVACKTAWIIQNEIEFESRRQSRILAVLFFFWFRIDPKNDPLHLPSSCYTNINLASISSDFVEKGIRSWKILSKWKRHVAYSQLCNEKEILLHPRIRLYLVLFRCPLSLNSFTIKFQREY